MVTVLFSSFRFEVGSYTLDTKPRSSSMPKMTLMLNGHHPRPHLHLFLLHTHREQDPIDSTLILFQDECIHSGPALPIPAILTTMHLDSTYAL